MSANLWKDRVGIAWERRGIVWMREGEGNLPSMCLGIKNDPKRRMTIAVYLDRSPFTWVENTTLWICEQWFVEGKHRSSCRLPNNSMITKCIRRSLIGVWLLHPSEFDSAIGECKRRLPYGLLFTRRSSKYVLWLPFPDSECLKSDLRMAVAVCDRQSPFGLDFKIFLTFAPFLHL